ncbi:9981_t:CDS:2, partial [Racocetra fulgida]
TEEFIQTMTAALSLDDDNIEPLVVGTAACLSLFGIARNKEIQKEQENVEQASDSMEIGEHVMKETEKSDVATNVDDKIERLVQNLKDLIFDTETQHHWASSIGGNAGFENSHKYNKDIKHIPSFLEIMSSNTNATTLPASTRSVTNARNSNGSWRASSSQNLNNSEELSYFSTSDNSLDSDRQKKLEESIKTSNPHPLANKEDPRNENGGAWSFRVSKANTAVVWRELLMMLIGEQFEDCVSKDDDIYGLTVSSRYNSDIFNIWNKNSAVNEEAKIMEKIKEALGPIDLQSPYYKGKNNLVL